MADEEEIREEEAPEAEEEEVEGGGEAAEGAEGENAEGEDGEGGPKKKAKKKLIIMVLALLLLVGGGGGAAFFLGFIGGEKDTEGEIPADLVPKLVYLDLDEFLVNLNTPGKQVSFLKMVITVELPNERAKSKIQSQMPRIRDVFQIFLRELRAADLKGSAGLVYLKEELMLRINKVIEPEEAKDILFKEIIVQ